MTDPDLTGFSHLVWLDCGCSFPINDPDRDGGFERGSVSTCPRHSHVYGYDPQDGDPVTERDRTVVAVTAIEGPSVDDQLPVRTSLTDDQRRREIVAGLVRANPDTAEEIDRIGLRRGTAPGPPQIRPFLAENEYEIHRNSEPLMVHYRNHRGEYAGRRIRPTGLCWFGVTRWHPEPQWFLDVIDVTNPSAPKHRSFALRDIQFSRPTGGR